MNTPTQQQLQRKAMLPVWIYYLALKLETDGETARLNRFIVNNINELPAATTDLAPLVNERERNKMRQELQHNHTGNEVDLEHVLAAITRDRLTAPHYYDIVEKLQFQLSQERTFLRQAQAGYHDHDHDPSTSGSSTFSSLRRRKRYQEKLELFRRYL
eukprot:GSA120T00017454001.1